MFKTTIHTLKASVLCALLFLLSSALSAETPMRNPVINTCLGCHGVPSYTNVYPTYHVPRLAGQHQEYLVAALKEYRSGNRQHPTMTLQARSLSDEHIQEAAKYFSRLPSDKGTSNPVIPKAIEAKVATCTVCHTADGNSIVPTFPRIAGQKRDYLQHTLETYKSGQRKNPIMLGIVQALSEDDMKALSAYYSQQAGLRDIDLGIQK